MMPSVPGSSKNMRVSSSPKMLLCLALAVLSISSISSGLPSALFLNAVRPRGQSCYERDHCDVAPSSERSCSCDDSCGRFGDCCADAPGTDGKLDYYTKCYDVNGVGGVYMVGQCPEDYEGVHDWREMCEDTGIADPSDPVGTMPVTDRETGTTYKNVYCKMCHGRSTGPSCFWDSKLECPLLPLFNESSTFTDDFVLQNLVLDEGAWGLNIHQGGGGGRDFFLDCFVSPAVPQAVRDQVRSCNPDLVSDCPTGWEDEEVRAKCLSYLGPRFTEDGFGYKNVHCAICNGADLEELSCQGPDFDPYDIFRFSATHSFALLMDINERMGSRVGMIKMCEDGDVYDPFFQRCRTLQCFPGFARLGLRCVRRKVFRKIFRKKRPVVSTTSWPFMPTTDDTTSETAEMARIDVTEGGFQGTESLSSTYVPSSTFHDDSSEKKVSIPSEETTKIDNTQDGFQTAESLSSTYAPLSTIHNDSSESKTSIPYEETTKIGKTQDAFQTAESLSSTYAPLSTFHDDSSESKTCISSEETTKIGKTQDAFETAETLSSTYAPLSTILDDSPESTTNVGTQETEFTSTTSMPSADFKTVSDFSYPVPESSSNIDVIDASASTISSVIREFDASFDDFVA